MRGARVGIGTVDAGIEALAGEQGGDGVSRRALIGWVDWVLRNAALVVVLAVALTGGVVVFTINTLGINTSTTDIISSDVPFRRNDLAFDTAFPQLRNVIVVVVDGTSPEAAEDAAQRLADRLGTDTTNFHDVYLPGAEPYFRRNGFLFLDVEALATLADRLAAIEPLLASLAADPSLRGLTNVLDLALAGADGQNSAELVELLGKIGAVAGAIPAGLPLDLSWQSLLAGDGAAGPSRRFVLARPILDHSGLKPAAAAIDAIRAAARALDVDADHGLRVRLTGGVVLDQEELDSVEVGGKTAGALSLVLVALLLIVGLRSGGLVLATIATLLMGLIWTAGFAALTLGELNLISVAFAVLFVGLGVDFGIHMCLRYREELAGDAEKAEAIRRAGGAVGGALALSALSAAAGFYAFLPTDYRGLAELGLIAGTGMFVALVANLTVLPALLTLLPRPSSQPWRRLSSFPLQRVSRPILAIAAILGIAAIFAVPLARFDFNPLNLKDPRTESVSTFLDLAADPVSTPYVIKVLADDLEAAGAIADRVADAGLAVRVVALSSFVPEDQDEKLTIVDDIALFLGPVLNPSEPAPATTDAERQQALARLRARLRAVSAGDDPLGPAAADLDAVLTGEPGTGGPGTTGPGTTGPGTAGPGTADPAAELERRLTVNLPRALAQLRTALEASEVTLDDLPEELRRRWQAADGSARVDIQPGIAIVDNSDLRRFADAVLEVVPTASGGPIIITQAGRVVLRAFLEATALAAVLISAILLVMLRRFADIVLVLVPLAFAALMTVAASVVLGLAFNFANVIVLPLLLGLGVSSSIHLVMRHREEGGGVVVLSSSTPRAVLFSSLTTVAAFGSLAVSGHRGMTSMGQLLTVAILFVLLATLVVLPCLMTFVGRRPPVAPVAPAA